MLLTLRFSGSELNFFGSNEEGERLEEFWFGRGFAWGQTESGAWTLRCSLLLDVPKLVSRTKRRDREERFAIGFCDPYSYSAWGLMGLFLARLRLPESGRRRVEIELNAYPERPHSAEVANRLFLPIGYAVAAKSGSLRLSTERDVREVVSELPALLLALDRKARLFLAPDELEEIATRSRMAIQNHPARRAILLALEGRPTPLRFLVPGLERRSETARETAPDDESVLGEDPILTALVPRIPCTPPQREHAAAVLSRMNVDRRWLIYLPPGVASVQASKPEGEIERPELALEYYSGEKIEKAVVEQKHMGSRGIVVLCQSSTAAKERFGIDTETPGCAYTRNGRRFFSDEDTEAVFIQRLGAVLDRAKFWRRFSTNWVCLDGEILPWAIKASESSEESDLVTTGTQSLEETVSALDLSGPSSLQTYWRELVQTRIAGLSKYDSMFKRYRSEAADLSAIRFAPFHFLAVEGRTFFNRSHLWHMETAKHLARSGEGFLSATRYEVASPSDRSSWRRVLAWWEKLSAESEEGLVVKPLPFVPKGRRGIAQPALKCRSAEHLRLVYGPEYDSVEFQESLRVRDALQRRRNKHRRIRRQFALSMEAVERFVKRSPMSAVHECVLGVLAQEVAPNSKT